MELSQFHFEVFENVVLGSEEEDHLSFSNEERLPHEGRLKCPFSETAPFKFEEATNNGIRVHSNNPRKRGPGIESPNQAPFRTRYYADSEESISSWL